VARRDARAGACVHRPRAGGVEPLGPVALLKPQDPKAQAVALLRVRVPSKMTFTAAVPGPTLLAQWISREGPRRGGADAPSACARRAS
jgi:hypothetical protein